MADEKKVIFTAQDGVSQKANQIYSGIIANAKKQTDSIREQNVLIEKQIKLLEKKSEIEKKAGKEIVSEQAALYGAAKTPAERKKYAERHELAKGQLEESSKVLDLLKEIASSQKKTTTIAEKSEKEAVKESQRKAKYEGQNLARREARANPKGILKQFAKTESEGYGDMSSEQIEKLQYQKKVIDSDRTESNFKSTLKALLVNDLVQGIARGISTVVGAQTGDQGFNSLLGGIPLVGGFASTAFSRSFEEQSAVGINLNKLRARSNDRSIGQGGNASVGFSSREALALQEGLLGAAGTSRNLGDTNGRRGLVSQAQGLERGLGLSESTLINIVKQTRTIGSNAELVSTVSKVLKSNPDLIKSPAKLEEVIQAQLSVTRTLASQTERVNQDRVSNVIGGLRSVGGNLANNPEYLAQVGGQINQSLTSPSNDFQKARSFGVLSGINPGASYFQLLKMKEQGVGQEGYVEGVLKQLKRETGGGENFALATMQNFGLQAGTAEKVTQMFEKNPSMFSGLKGGTKDIENLVGVSRSEEFTHERDRQAARQGEAYLEGPLAGATESVVQTLEVGGKNIAGALAKLSAAIWSGDVKPKNGIKTE